MTDRLYRSRNDRMLAGVAGGLAEHWSVDPSLVRVVWAVLVPFTAGVALFVYIVAAIVVPEEGSESWSGTQAPWTPAPPAAPTLGQAPTAATPGQAPADGNASRGPDAGSGPWEARQRDAQAGRAARREARRQRGESGAPAVIGILLVLLGGFFLVRQWLPQLDFDWFWPLMLIGVGVILLVVAVGRRPSDPGSAT